MENPFGKEFSEIEIADLSVLKEISEGWYYEYKQQVIKPKDIAKSVSALANTFGGWLFFGIKSSNSSRTAEAFPGIPSNELGQAETHIRQAVSGSINPPPFFESRVLEGPNSDLDLPEHYGIIVVRVPRGQNCPYVHSSGRIFRRVGDESSPREEIDRHLLDQLWQRSREHQEKFSATISEPPHRSDFSTLTPVLKIFVFHDLWKDGTGRCAFTLPTFNKLMKEDQLPFATIFPSSDSFIGLQTQGNNPSGLLLQWRHRFGCIDEISIPLNIIWLQDRSLAKLSFADYDYGTEFLQECDNSHRTQGRVIDLSFVYSILNSITTTLEKVFAIENVKRSLFVKMQLSGIRGAMPFVDDPNFIKLIRDSGIPILQDDMCFCPSGKRVENVIMLLNSRTGESEWDKDPAMTSMMNAIILYLRLCAGFGFDVQATGFPDLNQSEHWEAGTITNWHVDLIKTAERSRLATKARSDREGSRY